MPCNCCNAPKPDKGHIQADNSINQYLKAAAQAIKRDYVTRFDNDYGKNIENNNQWKEAWIEAFRHHLYGCPEGNAKES